MFQRNPPKRLHRYGISLLAFACALLLNLSIDPFIREESPFVLFFAAVLVSAWYGGFGPGLATTLAAVLTSHALFLGKLGIILAQPEGSRTLRLGLFFVEGVVISLLSEAYKRKEEERAHAESLRQQLASVVERKQDLVQALAEGFLKRNPEIPGFEASYFYLPSSREDMVGGDFFDFLPLSETRQGVMIGDVCGKGLPAAVYTSKAKYMLHAYALEDPAPSTSVARLNRALSDEMGNAGLFISLVYGVLDSREGTFTYANAGHPPPLLFRRDTGEVTRLEVTGGVIGMDSGMEFRPHTVTLPPGSVLLFFTDGLMEAVGSEDPYADGGVSPIIRQQAGAGAEAVARAVFDRARRLMDKNRRDDMAIIALRRAEEVNHPPHLSLEERQGTLV